MHHGNGIQNIFEQDKNVLYFSIHRHDKGLFYPGSGKVNECGTGEGEGYTVNIPWNSIGMTDNDYIFAIEFILLPIAYSFKPDLILVFISTLKIK